MNRAVLMAALIVVLSASSAARAQTYAQNQVNGQLLRNSQQGFSSERMRNNLFNRTVPQYSFSQVNRGLFNSALTGRPMQKPFSGASSGGSVSPWLALSEPFTSSAHNYYTQVRPQLEQQRINQQLAQRNRMIQGQLNDLAARPPYNPAGSQAMAPTGHQVGFLNYGGYYTPARPTKGRR